MNKNTDRQEVERQRYGETKTWRDMRHRKTKTERRGEKETDMERYWETVNKEIEKERSADKDIYREGDGRSKTERWREKTERKR